MDSSTLVNTFKQKVTQEAAQAQAQTLIERTDHNCFKKCLPNPGSSLSGSEQTCHTQCVDKYIAAWNQVNKTYIERMRKETQKQQDGLF